MADDARFTCLRNEKDERLLRTRESDSIAYRSSARNAKLERDGAILQSVQARFRRNTAYNICPEPNHSAKLQRSGYNQSIASVDGSQRANVPGSSAGVLRNQVQVLSISNQRTFSSSGVLERRCTFFIRSAKRVNRSTISSIWHTIAQLMRA